ncbi:MAG: ribonuclease III [Anaerolineae bacterium]|nr:ribonuclease III [Anaerolineae bacterium]MDW8170963.1 ribonuclease III [Anaerolineae bacterium]
MADVENVLARFQETTGLHFSQQAVLQEALTHRSFINESLGSRHNERLEFLGDALLGMIVTEMLFRRFPQASEGQLSQLRSAMVKAETLAQLAESIHLGDFLLLGRGEELSGGRRRQNNLCRGFEALVGGLFIDGGLEAVRAFLDPMLDGLLERILRQGLHLDARSVLQERSQAELQVTPTYRTAEVGGEEHDKIFTVEVLIGRLVVGRGSGASKRSAGQLAAQDALRRLLEAGDWPEDVRQAAQERRARREGRGVADGPPS